MLLLPSSFLSILSWKLQDHSDSWSLIWELFCFFFGQLQYLLFMHSVQKISLCYVQICESVFIHCTGSLVGPFKIKTCLFFFFFQFSELKFLNYFFNGPFCFSIFPFWNMYYFDVNFLDQTFNAFFSLCYFSCLVFFLSFTFSSVEFLISIIFWFLQKLSHSLIVPLLF